MDEWVGGWGQGRGRGQHNQQDLQVQQILLCGLRLNFGIGVAAKPLSALSYQAGNVEWGLIEYLAIVSD